MRLLTIAVRLLTVAIALVIAPVVSQAQVDVNACGDFRSHLQWDYRTATPKQHDEVEGAHFVPKVENLISGNRGYLGGDLQYTIGASPNHHRALVSIMRWSERLKSTKLPDMYFPVECYFIRGLNFRPDDNVVRMLYAQFLINQARPADAARQLEQVAAVSGDNGFTLYNIGLLYSDMKDYTQTLAYAHKAMALGFERPELRKRLEAVGRWTDPVASSAGPAASSADAPPASAASADVPKQD